MSEMTPIISALQLEDVPVVAKLSAQSFVGDRNTEVKALGREPFDMEKYTLGALPKELKRPHIISLKATDPESGELMGFCKWGFRGFAPEEMPVLEGRVESEPLPVVKPEEKPQAKADPEPKPGPEPDGIAKLETLTSDDLSAWMKQVMPDNDPSVRCIYVVGLSVDPRFQGRGVGSKLLKFGTDFCDRSGAFAWVHSSEGAWGMYAKSGFEIVRELDVDLDEFAPGPPPGEGEGARWGHYVFRYMKYFGKQSS